MKPVVGLRHFILGGAWTACKSKFRQVGSLHPLRSVSSPADGNMRSSLGCTHVRGQIVVIGGGALGSLFAGRLGTLEPLKGRVWMLTAWEEQAKVACMQTTSRSANVTESCRQRHSQLT